MAVTPTNGRVAFLALQTPHTYWELNSTNLGTNYGSQGSGANNTAVAAGDISTSDSYEGMNSQNDPPQNILLDTQIVTDAAFLLYIPAGLTHNTPIGIFHNGGGTHAQGCVIRPTTSGVEIAVTHNASGTLQDVLIHEIPDADLPGWFTVGCQFSGEGGAQGDMGLWIDGTKVRNATRSHQLQYGSGNPDFGQFSGDPPLQANVRDPSSYSGGNWSGSESSINGTGVLIANFCADNAANSNSSPNGNGDAFYTDYHDAHTVSASVDDLLADDAESASELTTPTLGQEHGLLADNAESASELTTPTLIQPLVATFDSPELSAGRYVFHIALQPAVTEGNLLADDVEAASELTTPTLGQEHALLADDVQSASELTAPTLILPLVATFDSPELSAGRYVFHIALQPAVTEDNLLADDVGAASEVTTPAIGQEHTLLADDVQSASELTTPTLGQEHALLADDVQSASELTTPALASFSTVDDLLADDVEAASELTTPSLGQEHTLLTNSVEAASELSTPDAGAGGAGYAILAGVEIVVTATATATSFVDNSNPPQDYSVTGATTTSVTPDAGLALVRNYRLTGSTTVSLTPAAALLFPRDIDGTTRVSVTPAAAMVYRQASGAIFANPQLSAGRYVFSFQNAIGDLSFMFADPFVSTNIWPAATSLTFQLQGGAAQNSISGTTSVAVTPDAALAFRAANKEFVAGSTTVTVTPEAGMVYADNPATPSLTGTTTLTVTPAAAMVFEPSASQALSFAGGTTVIVTPEADLLALAVGYDFAASTRLLVTPHAETAYQKNNLSANSTTTLRHLRYSRKIDRMSTTRRCIPVRSPSNL